MEDTQLLNDIARDFCAKIIDELGFEQFAKIAEYELDLDDFCDPNMLMHYAVEGNIGEFDIRDHYDTFNQARTMAIANKYYLEEYLEEIRIAKMRSQINNYLNYLSK
jgi:hypothetical protein